MNKLSVLLFLVVLSNTSLIAQEHIILYNDVPMKVELIDGEIKTILGEAPSNYMAGYEMPTKIRSIAPKVRSINSSNEFVKAEQEEPFSENIISEPSRKNITIDQLSNEFVTLYFDSNHAKLSQNTLVSLDEAAQKIQNGDQSEVLLVGYSVTGRPTTKVLANKRLKAAKTYLVSKGVPFAKIHDDLQITDNDLKDTLYLSFVNL